jgi:aspartyl-tRNA(Asn)/glutamyl-tRNA(Gln) amidotransferase subunit A
MALPEAEAPRVGRLGGWFARNVSADLLAAIDGVAAFLDAADVELPHVAAARSAAFLMTAAEGGALHLPDLRRRPLAFDPQTRDRLIAGALLPAGAYGEAARFREAFRRIAAELFERFDVLIAPSVGVEAPPVEAPTVEVDGQSVPARAYLGLHTQPISFIGLPVIAAPLVLAGGLPLGIQLIGAPGAEPKLFALAARLERAGLIAATPVPALSHE